MVQKIEYQRNIPISGVKIGNWPRISGVNLLLIGLGQISELFSLFAVNRMLSMLFRYLLGNSHPSRKNIENYTDLSELVFCNHRYISAIKPI